MMSSMRRFLISSFLLFVLVSSLQASVYTVGQEGCDFYRIQAALDSAGPGDTIEVHSGDYYVNLNITTPMLALRGVDTGAGKPVLHAGSSEADIVSSSGGTTEMTVRSGGTAIAIREFGCTVDGFNITGVTWPKPDDTGENNDLIGNSAIRVYSDLNIISNNTFCGNDLTAIGLWNCSSNQIRDNLIKDIPYGYGMMIYNSHNNEIKRNLLVNNDWSIEMQRSDGNIIEENEIRESINDAIRAMNCNSSTIVNNIISESGKDCEYDGNGNALYLVGSMNLVLGNIIFSNKENGIFVRSIFWGNLPADESYENMIMRNHIRDSGKDGIRLDRSWENQLFENNITSSLGNGISLIFSHNNTLELSNISNSQIGIDLDQSNFTRIANSTIREQNKSGIRVWMGRENSIEDNVLDGDSQGILLYESATGCVCLSNKISNGTEGISISGRSSGNSAVRNRIISCLTGIAASNCERNTLQSNVIEQCNRAIALDSLAMHNTIYENDLFRNGEPARDEGSNSWDNSTIGNYFGWTDCLDDDADNICDSPFLVAGGSNVDRFPIATLTT